MTTTAPPRQTPLVPPPPPRGPMSEQLLEDLAGPPRAIADLPLCTDTDPWADDDAALALYLCYELHYRGLLGVDDGWEWEPSLLRERRRLEQAFEASLRDAVGPPPAGMEPRDAVVELRRLAATDAGPSLSSYMELHGTVAQMREFAIHRSAYQLKEADPHTWAIPRLVGRSKAALVTIQMEEYGGGVPEEVHARLFADTMVELGLDPAYGAYLSALPATTLATCNLVSLLGLHRRWRGALVGHLALFEMCSVGPMGRYAAALRRLWPGGAGGSAARFYEVHVAADARHELIAIDDLVGGLLSDEPQLAGDVVFGARALAAVEGRFADSLLVAWGDGRSALRREPPG
jgi:hypothetical protein